MKPAVLLAVAFVAILPACASKQMLIEAMAPAEKIRRLAMEDAEIYARQTSEFLELNGEAKTFNAATLAVQSKLSDPESARFRNVRLEQYLTHLIVCGEVNAKNAYGGYVGFRSFMASPRSAAIYQYEDDDRTGFTRAANAGIVAACRHP